MRKVIRKQIRRTDGGINIAADVNAVIATGEGEKTHTSVSSKQRVVQRSEAKRAEENTSENEKEEQ